MSDILNDYSVVLQQIKIIEKQLQDKLTVLVKKQKIEQFRPRDHNRRFFDMPVYFDKLNLEFFKDENIKEIRDMIVEFEKLRSQQKHIESEIDKLKANDFAIKRGFL